VFHCYLITTGEASYIRRWQKYLAKLLVAKHEKMFVSSDLCGKGKRRKANAIFVTGRGGP
jgi:hypothetical protein